MGTPNTISFRIPDAKKEALDKIAGLLDRDRTWVINEAIDHYLDLHRWQIEHISKAVARADGPDARWYSSDQVRSRIAKLEAARKKRGTSKAAK